MKNNRIQTSLVTILFIALGVYFAMMIRGGNVEIDNTATGNVLNNGIAKVVDENDTVEADGVRIDPDDTERDIFTTGNMTCPVAYDIESFKTYVVVADEMPPLKRITHTVSGESQYEYIASPFGGGEYDILSESPSYTYPPHARPQPIRSQEMVIMLGATRINYHHEDDIPESRRAEIRNWLSNFSLVTHAYASTCLLTEENLLYEKYGDVVEMLRITSSSDFSEQFPAGSSLNRLFDVRHMGVYSNVPSPYRVSDSPDVGFYNVDEFVGLQPKVRTSIQFALNTEPTASDTHQFFIEYRDSGGRDLTVSTQTIVFEMDAAE